MTTDNSERFDNEGEKFEEYDNSIRVKTRSIPASTYYNEVALGNVDGATTQPISAIAIVQEGSANEQVIGDGMTGRYPFPSTAAQMTIVSTSANDDITGTGARVLLVRGNITGNVELFEAVLLDGTNPVTTSNEYLRVNSIGIVSAGSTGYNEGTITLKNGSDLLAQINIGNNLSHTAIFSIPTGSTGLIGRASFFTGKDDNATILIHVREPELDLIDFLFFEQKTYLNQINLEFNPAALSAGTDLEMTAYAETDTGDSQVGVVFDPTIIDD